MSEERQNLRKTLKDLHQQLMGLDAVSPETDKLLRTVAADIDNVLDPESPESGSPDLIARWREALLEFEGHHPQLTQTIDQVATALANIGL